MPLNWLTRLLRTVCSEASTTGADVVVKVIELVSVPPIAPPAVAEPRVDEANARGQENLRNFIYGKQNLTEVGRSFIACLPTADTASSINRERH